MCAVAHILASFSCSSPSSKLQFMPCFQRLARDAVGKQHFSGRKNKSLGLFLFNFYYILSLLYICVHVGGGVQPQCMCEGQHVGVSFLYHVGHKYWPQVIRHSSKCLYLMNHPTGTTSGLYPITTVD